MSNLETAITALSKRIKKHGETIETEEAVKTSVVLPFLQGLGYDVFDPSEVTPEFTADVAGKRGEKVDYAIQQDGKFIILIECKGLRTALDRRHLAQLYRYFSVTSAKFAILTNGKEYRFYSDLNEPNKLDQDPFFVFDITDHTEAHVAELSKFTKDNFSVENILADAERLKHVAGIRSVLERWFAEPPENLVKLIAAEVYEGRLNQNVRQALASATTAAFREIVRDRVRSRLSSALEDPDPINHGVADAAVDVSDIVTTQEEVEGFLTVKSILSEKIDPGRVYIRDAKSYCAVLLDNNNRKPLARLHFNRGQKYVGLFDGDNEERVPISSLNEIYQYRGRLLDTCAKYE